MKFEKISESMYEKFIKDNSSSIENDEQRKEKIKYFKDDVSIPKRATEYSAGYDFIAPYDFMIEAGKVKKIGSGIKANLNSDEVLMLVPRSSIGIKKGISLANTVGIVDSDYYNNNDNEGHILFFLKNNTDSNIFINKGTKIIQGIVIKYQTTGEYIKETRVGGIGSTTVEQHKPQPVSVKAKIKHDNK